MIEPLPDQTLLLDADDTLWENNVYFERAFEDFVAFLNHDRLTPDEVRAVLDQFERQNMAAERYGSRAFAASLADTWREITGSTDDAELRTVERFGLDILELEFELMDDVEETLTVLHEHHDLLMVTKGDREEQQRKIDRSPVSQFFDEHIIVPEKHAGTYRELADSRGLDATRTWMIGNSPRSDIFPALEAGLNAILIPHEMTWHLEHAEQEHDTRWPGRFLEIPRFRKLLDLFAHHQ